MVALSVCGMHQIPLCCSATALLELLVVGLVLITAYLERFFQADYNYIAVFTQITFIFLETDDGLLLQEDLFQQPGLRSEFEQIRDCLDKGMHDTLRILLDWCPVRLTVP